MSPMCLSFRALSVGRDAYVLYCQLPGISSIYHPFPFPDTRRILLSPHLYTLIPETIWYCSWCQPVPIVRLFLACSPCSLALFCDADYHLNSLLLSSSFPPALEIVAHVFGRLITVFFVPSLLEIRPDKFTWSLPSSRLG